MIISAIHYLEISHNQCVRLHSDRGSQYASKGYRSLLKFHHYIGSMSKKGDCWDNSVIESFFGSLKQERVQWRNYQTNVQWGLEL